MTATATAPPDPSIQLIAARLGDIATTVGREAEEATTLVRAAADQARATALIAAEFEDIAALVRSSVHEHAALLAEARTAAAGGLPVIEALTIAGERISTMSTLIDTVAKRSRMLALNARIEGARAGAAGRGFEVVATKMSSLAGQTRDATGDIDQRATAIGQHVGAAQGVFEASVLMIDRQEAMIGRIVAATDRQREAAGAVADLTNTTVEEVEHAATIIGRVASAAAAVGLLARQLTRDRSAVARAA